MHAPSVSVHTPYCIFFISFIASTSKSGFSQKSGQKNIVKINVKEANKKDLPKYFFIISKQDLFEILNIIMRVMKYCKKIIIPDILIENKKAVDRANKKIFNKDIFSLL